MGLISKILSFTRDNRGAHVSDVKIDNGGNHNVTAEHFSSAGDDSFPLKTDYVLSSHTKKSGGQAAHGYLDPLNEPKATEGEKRIYARDKDTGLVVVESWLKNDGSAKTFNAAGYFELLANGTVNINGVTIAPDGTITTPTAIIAPSVVADGKELTNHDHTITSGSSAGTTSTNN